jgi:hypothetical protein
MIIERKKMVLAAFFFVVLAIVALTNRFWTDARPFEGISTGDANKRVSVQPGMQDNGNKYIEEGKDRGILVHSADLNASQLILMIFTIFVIVVAISVAYLIILNKALS